MATYTFKLVTGANNKYKKDGGPYHRLRQVYDNIDPTQGVSGSIDSLIITSARGNDVIATGDTVIILAADGSTTSTTVLSSGNLDATYDALNALFPKAGGTAITSLDALADGTTRFALTAAQQTFLNGLMAVNNPSGT